MTTGRSELNAQTMRSGAASEVSSKGNLRRPVVVFAALGGVLALVEIAVLARWISGPQFERVPVGESPMEGWRSVTLRIFEIGFTVGALLALYLLLVRPWLRERRVTFDGLLAVCALLVSIYDPMSGYWHQWFTYNAFFFNRGSAVTSVPGWHSFAEPGEQIAWPIFLIPGEYVVSFVLLALLGTQIMKVMHSRWRDLSGIAWIAPAVTFLILGLMSVLFEGFMLIPLAIYQMSGIAPFEFMGNHNAAKNIVFFALAFTAAAVVRYYRNDRGQTFIERGAETTTPGRAIGLRFLAVYAFMHLVMFVGYHIPVGIWSAMESDAPWMDSMIENTWMNNGICGAGTPRLCPGQDAPLPAH